MRFWDSSAVVPLVSREPESARARRLLEVHPLTAADALHLGAALVVVEERTDGVEFVSFDDRLASAARREGFSVLGAA